MSWLFLLIAGIFEIGFTTSLKMTQNFTRLWPTCIFLGFAAASFYFLNRSLESIPLGVAYAVWTGIGAAGTLLVSHFYFNEALSIAQLIFLSLLIGSIIGLKTVP